MLVPGGAGEQQADDPVLIVQDRRTAVPALAHVTGQQLIGEARGPPAVGRSRLQYRIALCSVVAVGQNMIGGQYRQLAVLFDQTAEGAGRDLPMADADAAGCRTLTPDT